MAKKENLKNVETLTHGSSRRRHTPTAEYRSILRKEEEQSLRMVYDRGVAGLKKAFPWSKVKKNS